MAELPARGLPKLYTEIEVADYLGVKPATVASYRRAGLIRPVRLNGQRGHRYLEQDIIEYLERCRDAEKSSDGSGATGFRRTTGLACGAEPGTTPGLDRHVEVALAKKIFSRPYSSSRSGTAPKGADRKPKLTKSPSTGA